jgi:hypothetical protein
MIENDFHGCGVNPIGSCPFLQVNFPDTFFHRAINHSLITSW